MLVSGSVLNSLKYVENAAGHPPSDRKKNKKNDLLTFTDEGNRDFCQATLSDAKEVCPKS